MSTEDSRAALVKKLRESQDQYTQWLSAQPVSEILNHAMEFSMREEIIQAVDKYASFITDEQTAVLLETKDPLPDIWKAYKDRPGRANFIIECTGRIADMEMEKLARPDDRRTQSLSAEDIANESGRICAALRDMWEESQRNHSEATHFQIAISPLFLMRATTQDMERLREQLPLKKTTYGTIEGREGYFAFFTIGADRAAKREAHKPSVRKALQEGTNVSAVQKTPAERGVQRPEH